MAIKTDPPAGKSEQFTKPDTTASNDITNLVSNAGTAAETATVLTQMAAQTAANNLIGAATNIATMDAARVAAKNKMIEGLAQSLKDAVGSTTNMMGKIQ